MCMKIRMGLLNTQNETHSSLIFLPASVNRPFPSYFELHYESEVKCKVFVMKVSFHSYANKTNFHTRSTTTQKWPISFRYMQVVFACTILKRTF